MENPLLAGAFKAAHDQIISEMVRADLSNAVKLQALIGALQSLHVVERGLKTHMETGQMAQISKDTVRDRLRRVVG